MSTSSASPNDQQPAELLRYLPEYKVVVCLICQYALQPDGIARHLKDVHHIYRARRRPFMKYVSQLSLDKPQNVREPHPSSFPVNALPVNDGLRCTADGCSHLCISVKRMRSHWMSVHGRQGNPDLDWQPVPLQTFFRGNLLKYFTNVSTQKLPTNSTIVVNVGDESTFERAAISRQPAKVDDLDKTLFQNYITSTSLTIATDDVTRTIWQETVPRLAYDHPFLMHGVLACSGLHLAYLNPTSSHFTIRARSHQDIAMPLFRAAIANPDRDNCDAILVFSHLLVIYSFASEKQDGRLLFVESNSPDFLPSWLHFLRAGCSMLCSVWDCVEFGPVKELASQWELPITIIEEHKRGAHEHLGDFFLSIIPAGNTPYAWSEEETQLFRDAAKVLDAAFICTRALDPIFTTWDALRIWPMQVPVEFLDLIRAGHPGALILLAHYCLLLKKLEKNWYFEGQATKLFTTVVNRLDKKWHYFVRWPMEEIGVEDDALLQDGIN